MGSTPISSTMNYDRLIMNSLWIPKFLYALPFIMVASFAACHGKVEHKVSKQFLHRSTQVISDDETVEEYYDLENDSLCYFYYFDGESQATALACVKQRTDI